MAGIDYGMGMANIDKNTGIRYGVMPDDSIFEWWNDASEADYGDPTCPQCGAPAEDSTDEQIDNSGYMTLHHESEYACDNCELLYGGESAYSDEPQAFIVDDGEYFAHHSGDSDHDVWFEKSPYYTLASFASPCAPGAGYITDSDVVDGVATYAPGADLYNEETPCNIHLWNVKDDSIAYCPTTKTDKCGCTPMRLILK